MIYLSLTIIGAIILVAYVIRRLPYMRQTRFGMDMANPPRPIVSSVSRVSSPRIIDRLRGIWSSVTRRGTPVRPPVESTVNPILTQPHIASPAPGSEFQPISAESSEESVETAQSQETADFVPAKEGDDHFWQEEFGKPPAPLELPRKGLISRRGEAQRVANALVTKADEAFLKKEYKIAEKYYLQAATKDPDNARIYNRLGVIYLQTKEYKDAIEAFKSALKFDDHVACRHYNMGLAYLGRRDYRSAERSLKESIRLDPTNEKYRKTLLALQKQPV